MRKLSTTEFVHRALETHGNLYDYSMSDYKNARTKITIGCRKHGTWEAWPRDHMVGEGSCPKCSDSYPLTTASFIEEAKKIHGDKYDYELVDYVNSNIKIKLICKSHGEFEQMPSSHLQGSGCFQCNIGKKRTTASFIEEAKKIHGDKYDYSLTIFTTMRTTVKIGCSDHGVFEMTPKVHLDKEQGCRECSYIQRTYNRKNVKVFIEEAKGIYGSKYEYNDVIYVNTDTKIKIICLDHGMFETTPARHLNGVGCPTCKKLNRIYNIGGYSTEFFERYEEERHKPGMLYFIEVNHGIDHFYKIGITKHNIKQRFGAKKYRQMYIIPLFEYSTTIYDAFLKEQTLLKQLKEYRYYPITRFIGYTECFEVKEEVKSIINNYLTINNIKTIIL